MSIITDPELLNKLSTWRARAADGSLTIDEMREAIKHLRANRMSTAEAAAKSKSGGGGKKKAPAAPVNAGDLLDQLNGL